MYSLQQTFVNSLSIAECRGIRGLTNFETSGVNILPKVGKLFQDDHFWNQKLFREIVHESRHFKEIYDYSIWIVILYAFEMSRFPHNFPEELMVSKMVILEKFNYFL